MPTSTIVSPRLSSRGFALKDVKPTAGLHVAFNDEIEAVKERGWGFKRSRLDCLREQFFCGFVGADFFKVEPQHTPELVQCGSQFADVRASSRQGAFIRRGRIHQGTDLMLKVFQFRCNCFDFLQHVRSARNGFVHELVQDSLLVASYSASL